jgi:hypothetical protein
MTRDLPMWALTALTLTFASSAHAGTITPDLVVVPVSPAFGTVAAGERVTDQFKAFGVIFSDGVATAIFDDPPVAFGGVNLAGTVDLVTPVNGFVVVPGPPRSRQRLPQRRGRGRGGREPAPAGLRRGN